jgi:hypothetical protein
MKPIKRLALMNGQDFINPRRKSASLGEDMVWCTDVEIVEKGWEENLRSAVKNYKSRGEVFEFP